MSLTPSLDSLPQFAHAGGTGGSDLPKWLNRCCGFFSCLPVKCFINIAIPSTNVPIMIMAVLASGELRGETMSLGKVPSTNRECDTATNIIPTATITALPQNNPSFDEFIQQGDAMDSVRSQLYFVHPPLSSHSGRGGDSLSG